MSVLKYKDPNTGEYKPVIGGGGGGTTVQPDYLQNDPTAKDYIKNRPFYSEMVTAFPERTLTFTNGQYFENGSDFSLTEGLVYVVTWEGVQYECIAKVVSSPQFGTGVGVGNMAVVGGENTGEPFAVASIPGIVLVVNLAGTETATIKIDGEQVHKIETKYVDSPVFNMHLSYRGNSPVIYGNAQLKAQLENAVATGKMIYAHVMDLVADTPSVWVLPLVTYYVDNGYYAFSVDDGGAMYALILQYDETNELFDVRFIWGIKPD